MYASLLLFSLLSLLLVLGFSYVVWILAKKETGWINTAGQSIACAAAAVALIIFLVSLISGGSMMRGLSGGTGPGMYKMDTQKMMEMMKEYEKGTGGRRAPRGR